MSKKKLLVAVLAILICGIIGNCFYRNQVKLQNIEHYLKKEDAYFQSKEAVFVANEIVKHQLSDGGWKRKWYEPIQLRVNPPKRIKTGNYTAIYLKKIEPDFKRETSKAFYLPGSKIPTLRKPGLAGSWERSTIDNGATTSQILILAKMYQNTGNDAYKKSCLKVIHLSLRAQY